MTDTKTANKTDVIIVGAGIAGLTLAKLLVDAGIKTTVLEKSKKGTGKNLSTIVNKELLKDENFPYQRILTEYRGYFLNKESYISASYKCEQEKNYISFSNDVNSYFAKKIEQSGGSIFYETVVRDLIVDKNKVIGVRTDVNEYFADCIVIAEGTNSVLAKKSGLRAGELLPGQVFLFIEEDLSLPAKTIEERFNILPEQGLSIRLFTQPYLNFKSIGYLNTNKNSISLGIGVLFSEIQKGDVNINDLLKRFKEHEFVNSLITGSKPSKYTSYMLPAPGHDIEKLPIRYFENGCLVIGGAAMLTDVCDWDLTKEVILSAKHAANEIILALKEKDYSAKKFINYKKQIIESKENNQ